jgi:hypothetical protein
MGCRLPVDATFTPYFLSNWVRSETIHDPCGPTVIPSQLVENGGFNGCFSVKT